MAKDTPEERPNLRPRLNLALREIERLVGMIEKADLMSRPRNGDYTLETGRFPPRHSMRRGTNSFPPSLRCGSNAPNDTSDATRGPKSAERLVEGKESEDG